MKIPFPIWPLQRLFIGCCCIVLSGCASQFAPPTRPEPVLPEAWQAQLPTEAQVPEGDWWQRFGSPRLEELVLMGMEGSPDLAGAVERVIQAEAQLRSTGSSLFPAVNLSGGTSAQRRSVSGGSSTSSESTNLSLGASYEVDVWGRIAADVRASEANLAASHFDYESVRLSLIAGVASGYFQLLALEERLAYSRENLAISERVLGIVEARQRHGTASALDLARQQSTVLSQRSTLLSLEQQQRQTRSALAILLGVAPQEFAINPEPFSQLRVPTVDPGMPSDLLLRRPDLARAEAQLVAADASIVAARTALFPSVSLSASAGAASSGLLSLSSPTSTLSLGASITQSIFDGGRRQSQIASAESRQRELLETYRKAILTALKEVEDALNTVHFSTQQEQLQTDILAETRRSLQLAELRYREGADDLLSVLDAQRSLFSAQDQMVQLQLTRLNGALELYKVLGGGWQYAGM